MTALIIAYTLIAVVLSGYGFNLWRRLRRGEAEIRSLEREE